MRTTKSFPTAKADVDFVTFSTDSSWGCEGWWNPPEEPENYAKIDSEFARLLKINPKALLVPRIMTDAPAWMHARHPDLRMIYEPHCSLEISSVSSRPYRQAACAAVEKLSRHLREKFPRNYAGLQISGQNSAEWFYMLSQSEYLSGYDPATRDAFREWLKARGDADWSTAEVPTYAERRKAAPPPRVVEFARFRNREMASFLVELGAAAKRGSGGHALTFFFYGYSWELGSVTAAETVRLLVGAGWRDGARDWPFRFRLADEKRARENRCLLVALELQQPQPDRLDGHDERGGKRAAQRLPLVQRDRPPHAS